MHFPHFVLKESFRSSVIPHLALLNLQYWKVSESTGFFHITSMSEMLRGSSCSSAGSLHCLLLSRCCLICFSSSSFALSTALVSHLQTEPWGKISPATCRDCCRTSSDQQQQLQLRGTRTCRNQESCTVRSHQLLRLTTAWMES